MRWADLRVHGSRSHLLQPAVREHDEHPHHPPPHPPTPADWLTDRHPSSEATTLKWKGEEGEEKEEEKEEEEEEEEEVGSGDSSTSTFHWRMRCF